MSKEYMNDGSLTEKWKFRFNFYEKHGFPGFWGATPEYKTAYKELKIRQRLTIQMNFIAFFFSWIYLFVLGLWKKSDYSSITWHFISICRCINWR